MIIVYLLPFVFILFLLTILRFLRHDFKNQRKGHNEYKFRRYISSQEGKDYIQSLGLISSILFGIIAIVFSAIYSGLTYEQVKIAKDSYLLQTNPIINIEDTTYTNRLDVKGMIIKNEGLNDIFNLHIRKDILYYAYDRKDETGKENIKSAAIYYNVSPYYKNELLTNESIAILFDTNEISGMKTQITALPRSLDDGSPTCNSQAGVIIYNFSFNRYPDFKEYKLTKYYMMVYNLADKNIKNRNTHGGSGSGYQYLNSTNTISGLIPIESKAEINFIDSIYKKLHY